MQIKKRSILYRYYRFSYVCMDEERKIPDRCNIVQFWTHLIGTAPLVCMELMLDGLWRGSAVVAGLFLIVLGGIFGLYPRKFPVTVPSLISHEFPESQDVFEPYGLFRIGKFPVILPLYLLIITAFALGLIYHPLATVSVTGGLVAIVALVWFFHTKTGRALRTIVHQGWNRAVPPVEFLNNGN